MKIVHENLGPEVSIDADLVNGSPQVSLKYSGKQVQFELSGRGDLSAFLDMAKGLIPGSIDDVVIDFVKAEIAKL